VRLADRQYGFSAAVINPGAEIPPGLLDPSRKPSQKRFSVYRNNVIVGLIEALRAHYPATYRLVGDEFFWAMARDYVLLEPPTSPLLFDFGARFPDFIEQFEPAGTLPYLADVARIERAWTETYHAPDQQALGADALSCISSYQIAELCLMLHPSMRVVRSRFPSVRIWRMNVGDDFPSPVDLESGAEDALVVRPNADVDVRSLRPGVASFVRSLAQGKTLMAATEAALSDSSSFEFSSDLAMLIAAGVFVGYRYASDATDNFIRSSSTLTQSVGRGRRDGDGQ
jgi:Putative DNA-binding domain